MSPKFAINLDEKFPNLDFAPIFEAIIHWQAPAGKSLKQSELGSELTKRLPDYPTRQTQYQAKFFAWGEADGSSQIIHRNQWNGFRLQSEDKHYVVHSLNRTLYGRSDIQVKACKTDSLQVTAKPLPNNPNHADIEGWPQQKQDQKVIALKLAAAASKLIPTPP